MIELFSGTPGSGKSLHAMDVISRWCTRFHRPVITNFYVNAKSLIYKGRGGILYVPNALLKTPDILIQFSEAYKADLAKDIPEEEILLVIDECQLIFNARAWNEAGRKEWISFFTQHRKLGYKVILIAQYDQMIDKQVRALLEYEYLHRKIKNIGKFGFILSLIVGGNLHITIKIYKPLNEKVGKEFFRAKKNVYKLYDTYNRF